MDSNVCLLEMLGGFCCKEFSALSVTCQPVAVLFGDSNESSTLNHQNVSVRNFGTCVANTLSGGCRCLRGTVKCAGSWGTMPICVCGLGGVCHVQVYAVCGTCEGRCHGARWRYGLFSCLWASLEVLWLPGVLTFFVLPFGTQGTRGSLLFRG